MVRTPVPSMVQKLPRSALLSVTIPVGSALIISLVLQILVLESPVAQGTLIAYIAWALSFCALWIAPQAGAVVALGGAAMSGLMGAPLEGALLAVSFAGIMAVSARPWCRRAYLVLALSWVTLSVWDRASSGSDLGMWVWWALCIGCAYVVGGLLRRTYERQQDAEERAVAVEAALEAAREAERRALAHELHDSLGHELTMIRMRSEAAGLAENCQGHETALRAISEAAGSAISDLHQVVSMRQEIPGDEYAGIQMGLDEVLELRLNELREGGHHPQLLVRGDSANVGLVLQHDLGRLIQEAVTNVLRHGAPSNAGEPDCWITLEVGETLDLTVTNRAGADGESAGVGNGRGVGMSSMDWRVRRLGGTFRAGPDDAGRWCLEAHGMRRECQVGIPASGAVG
ncbi:sensor histidine kinase [Nesterenkonia sp. K-15-9-6]|uniref:sensor histidine kinase n=1 Tax=Nesterenkonia sp. K-15-9-6 TaxID=3093918 RepID=UPI004043A7EE